MSLFPQSLWRPTPKDALADFNPEQRWITASITIASAAFGLITPQAAIPADKMMLVSNVQWQAVPGAGQSVTRTNLRWGVLNNAGAFVAYGALDSSDTLAAAPDVQRNRTWSPGPPGFTLMGGQVFEVAGFFDAGVANNALAINVVGVLIPRGNWQRT